VRRAGQILLLIMAALAVALATLLETPDAKDAAPRIDVVEASGDVVIQNSKENMPIIEMDVGAAPGDTAEGQVTLTNTGTARGYFYLAALDLVSEPGPGGGRLADYLSLRVTLDKGGQTSKKYGGLLANMGTHVAGRFSPGESGTYTFKATFPDTGVPAPPTQSRPVRGDNKWQGTEATVTFGWAPDPG
jgi:hypothetical protein